MAADDDVTRRTWLAAERTWLAWWRTALGAAVAGLGVGRVAPALTGKHAWAFGLLGAGYALLAVAIFATGMQRWRRVEDALRRGAFDVLGRRATGVLSAAGAVLALATVVLILLEL